MPRAVELGEIFDATKARAFQAALGEFAALATPLGDPESQPLPQ